MRHRYWIGVASREHVKLGMAGGFSQLCHGKSHPLKRMAVGNWLIYYSPKERFDEAVVCQKFTAIGQVVGEKVYPFEMSPGFIPYRRDVGFLNADDVPIRPLIDQLSFIKDKSRWGYAFRFGHLEIPRPDFEVIATSMLGYDPSRG
ncbi:MAG: EVE domain-containing protein [Ferrovum sp.]|jgi:predicted RNA-binding protein|nr:EVE domain-containing protein [Ferrovum sp.]